MVEGCVKALAQYYDLKDVLAKVNNRGGWTVTELEKAVERISEKLGERFTMAWDRAWVLHMWRPHEEKPNPNAIRIRLPYIERMVNETIKLVRARQNSRNG